MTQCTIGWRVMMLVCGIVVSIASSLDDARAAEAKGDSEQRGRVIYNLDRSEFFVGTFGPVVPETIDKWVDAHAAAHLRHIGGSQSPAVCERSRENGESFGHVGLHSLGELGVESQYFSTESSSNRSASPMSGAFSTPRKSAATSLRVSTLGTYAAAFRWR